MRRAEFERGRGMLVVDGQLDATRCRDLLDAIGEARAERAAVEVQRARRGRSLHYEVIDGERVARELPAVQHLYGELLPVAEEITGRELIPLQDRLAAANVNIITRRGEYRWHYDRNEVTILLYLNPADGGELECHPGYRLFLRNRLPRVQRVLDTVLATAIARRLFGHLVAVVPAPGRMVIMRGDRCLHSVRPVDGDNERVNLVFAYREPGARAPRKDALDSYLFTRLEVAADPNYQHNR